MKSLYFANTMLIFVTVVWGLTFPMIKTVASEIDPSVFVAGRFLLAALMFIPFISLRSLFSRQLLWAGFVLGSLNSGVYFLQTMALENLSAARCAFLTGTVVVWVPLFNYILLGIRPRWGHLCAATLCLFGLYILTGADLHGIGLADIEMLLAEACFGLTLLYIEKVGSECNSLFTLTFYQIIFTCPIPLFISLVKGASWQPFLSVKVILAVLFCALFATFITLLLQLKYQPRTTSIHASLIYSLEPFWAAVFSSTLFGEVLTHSLMLGGSIMISSLLFSEILKLYQQRRSKLILESKDLL